MNLFNESLKLLRFSKRDLNKKIKRIREERKEIINTYELSWFSSNRAYIHVEPFQERLSSLYESLQSRRTQTKPQYNPENPLRNLINYYNSRSDSQNPRSTICKDVDHKNTHNSVKQHQIHTNAQQSHNIYTRITWIHQVTKIEHTEKLERVFSYRERKRATENPSRIKSDCFLSLSSSFYIPYHLTQHRHLTWPITACHNGFHHVI